MLPTRILAFIIGNFIVELNLFFALLNLLGPMHSFGVPLVDVIIHVVETGVDQDEHESEQKDGEVSLSCLCEHV